MKEDYVNIGKRLPRIDGIIKATGEAKFAGDLSLDGMLHGKILRSPYPHARVLHIRTDKVKRLAGVRAVVTGKDTIGFNAGGISATGDEIMEFCKRYLVRYKAPKSVEFTESLPKNPQGKILKRERIY